MVVRTVIGQTVAVATPPPSLATLTVAPTGTGQAVVPYTPPANFPVALTDQEAAAVTQQVAAGDIFAIHLLDIGSLGDEPEKNLGRMLDEVLGKIDMFDNPELYKLFRTFSEKVAEAKLPEVADRIINGKPTGWENFKMIISNAKARQKALDEFFDETKRIASGKTKTLVDLVGEKEKALGTAETKLVGEIQTFEQLKDGYVARFREFAVVAAFLQAFLAKAQGDVSAKKAKMDATDPAQKAEMDGFDDKLKALESRSLNVYGSLLKIAAKQVTIRQLQNAGIQTLTETKSTALSRFNGIKMTLIELNGALAIKSVQRLAQAGADLDDQLMKVDALLSKEVVTVAANAAGDNRVAQAEQIKKIVADAQELDDLVEKARVSNVKKFADARKLMDESRQDLLALGQKVQPGKPLAT